jgi:acetoin utilization protein AcuB
VTATIREYMTPGPHTIGREQSLVAARQLMHKNHIRHLPVLHGGELVGVVSDRELEVMEALPGSKQLSVEDAMVPAVYTTSEDTPLATVAADMSRLKLGSVVVVDGGHVVGVFTASDGLRALARLLTDSPQNPHHNPQGVPNLPR